MKPSIVAGELRTHAPFTAFGTLTGIIIMAAMIQFHVSRDISNALFWFFHPLHVL